jgi:serine protease Do
MSDRVARFVMSHRWAVALLSLLAAWSFLPFPGEGSELRQTPIVKAVQKARPSVVNIRGEKTVSAPEADASHIEAGRRVNGMGTGVVIDPRGYIVTNHHVVDGVREIQVTQADGKRSTAKLVARDPETDLAIIKIDAPQQMPTITVGKSNDLLPGETVIAVGNAYGYEHTVTRGIISALHRAVQVSDAQFYEDLIQTDASINPGNSGGPLLNIDGEMIGINVAVRAGAQGIGFAIPVDKVMSVAGQMVAAHNQKEIWLGVGLVKEPSADANGLLIASVDQESPAAKAGLQAGDLVTFVGPEKIERGLDFHRGLLEKKAGETIRMTVQRDGQAREMTLTLAAARKTVPQGPNSPSWEVLGVELKPIADETFRQQYKTRYRGGLSVVSVRADSPASEQGIRRGDVLVGMHIWETVSLENVAYILSRPDLSGLAPIKFFILRGNETLYGFLPVAMSNRPQPQQQAQRR